MLSGRRDKLTVAHFLPWSGLGGVEIATLRMVEATREEFRHVAFCLPDAAVTESFAKAGVETVTYTAPVPSLRHGYKYYLDSKALAWTLDEIGVDIVHFAETKAAEHNSLAALLAGSRVVCHVRNTYPHLSLRQRLPLIPVDRFLFVSEEARRKFGVSLPGERTRVIYDAIELPEIDVAESNRSVRAELGIALDATVVGMVARVNPQKDYFTLADAAAEVVRRYPAVRFLIVGDHAMVELNRRHYEAVARRLAELGIAGNFIFTGHRSDVYRLIAAMDIAVLTTHREGFGLCIAEAMAMRKPVVATAVGGLLEVVKHGVTGYLHGHQDSRELAGEILSLMESPQEAGRLGAAGYEHVRRSYSREAFTLGIARSYRELMGW
jgi:glycosyltransferase involved in cell wall biosynthesis